MTDTVSPPPAPPAPPPPPAPPSPPPAAPAPAGKFYDGVDGFDDELRVHIEKSGYKSWADVAKSERAHAAMIGADKATLLRLPKDRSDPAQWAEINKALGFPDKVEDYKLEPNDALGLDRATLDSFLGKVHGKNPADVPRLAVEWYLEQATALGKQVENAQAARASALDKELTTLFGEAKDERIAALNAIVAERGGEELAAFLEETGLGNDLRMIKFLDWVHGATAEQTKLPGGRPASGAQTPQEAEAHLREFERANAGAIHDRNHPDHKALVAERQKLIEKAYPAPQR